jgi:hypothetical protein
MRTLLIAIALLAGCDSSATSPPDAPIDADLADAPTLQSISVAPTSITIAPGGTVQLVVTGHYVGGATNDLTFRAAFESTPTAVATVTSDPGLGGDRGRVIAQATGTATITASVLGSTATATVVVAP